jgi:hypothetical protein
VDVDIAISLEKASVELSDFTKLRNKRIQEISNKNRVDISMTLFDCFLNSDPLMTS